MATNSLTVENNLNPAVRMDRYTSMMLEMYVETVKQGRDVQVLDIGPVCGETIQFFARCFKRIHVCDMFVRLDRDRRKKPPPDNVWRHLDYPPNSFDGIHLWDMVDHLEDAQVSRLAELCFKMLRPKGLLMIIAFDRKLAPSRVHSFMARDNFELKLQPQTHLDLPWHFRHNRGLLALLSPFSESKSFFYRNGLREFLFQKD